MKLRLCSEEAAGVCQIRAEGEIRSVLEPRTLQDIEELLGPQSTFDEVRDWLGPDEGRALYGARGCRGCLQTGYSGRTGVFEVMHITRELRPLIAAGRPTDELRETASRARRLDLCSAALLRVARGLTNAEEVIRAIPPEDLRLDE